MTFPSGSGRDVHATEPRSDLPDLQADDPTITDQVARSFPQYTGKQGADVVRCLAEYAEQTIAKNHGTVPPDGQDHN